NFNDEHLHPNSKGRAGPAPSLRTAVYRHLIWWARRDSNPHPLRGQILSLVRLPVPPRARSKDHDNQQLAACHYPAASEPAERDASVTARSSRLSIAASASVWKTWAYRVVVVMTECPSTFWTAWRSFVSR